LAKGSQKLHDKKALMNFVGLYQGIESSTFGDNIMQSKYDRHKPYNPLKNVVQTNINGAFLIVGSVLDSLKGVHISHAKANHSSMTGYLLMKEWSLSSKWNRAAYMPNPYGAILVQV
jgi:hypothetical protein